MAENSSLIFSESLFVRLHRNDRVCNCVLFYLSKIDVMLGNFFLFMGDL